MLVVQPDVERDPIEWAVVAVRLLRIVREIVLLDPTGAERVEAHRKERGSQQIEQHLRSEQHEHGDVERHDRQPVQHGPAADETDFLQARRTRDLEEWKQEQPYGLAEHTGPDESGLPTTRDVGVQLVNALERVVLEMIAAKRDRRGKHVR